MLIEKKNIKPFYYKKKNFFDKYKELILEKNELYGLTTVKDDEFEEKHFYDSLSVLPLILRKDYKNLKIADVGSGAGFPSIPLLLVETDLNIDLIESNHKKAKFLTEVIDKFSINSAKVICSNVREIREKYDIVIFRAFSSLQDFFKVAKSLLKEGTSIYALKGKINEIEKEIFIVKKQNLWKYINVFEIHQVTGFQWERNIVEIIWGK
ncbi:MAG: 16S rRNA (guanine(527)-N(7))-methyltransferase RsmG [Spirochaetales bacterium]|nr:16S rRNA (guanine(527)-N(7))-methyltransferase RsmG [Spirochaetales bacterium]